MCLQMYLHALRFGVLWSEDASHDPDGVLEHLKRVPLFVSGGVSVKGRATDAKGAGFAQCLVASSMNDAIDESTVKTI